MSPSRAPPWPGSWTPSQSRSAWACSIRSRWTYVRKYTNMKFEPAGITDDPELRIATSLVDYIFHRIALDYLSLEERTDLGILSTYERTSPRSPGRGDGHAIHQPDRRRLLGRAPASCQRRRLGAHRRRRLYRREARTTAGPGRATRRPLLLQLRERHAARRLVLARTFR